ncbi:MAG: hypothetical protein LUG51_04930 [Tannerellaceae bacterium]|nr:hypothetical protein [Tannerellaceae bacterium]
MQEYMPLFLYVTSGDNRARECSGGFPYSGLWFSAGGDIFRSAEKGLFTLRIGVSLPTGNHNGLCGKENCCVRGNLLLS